MTQGSATYEGEDITVVFGATGVKSDYGVDGSPTWIEWENFQIESLEVFGREIEVSTLSKELKDIVLNLTADLEFEPDEQ
jgi:hypothetical protein